MTPPSAPVLPIAIVAASVIAFVLLAWGNIRGTSRTTDETTHLAAGYSYLLTGDYRMNPEHPPLLKKLAALPLLMMDVWPPRLSDPRDGGTSLGVLREAWAMGVANPMAQWYFAHSLFYSVRDPVLRRVRREYWRQYLAEHQATLAGTAGYSTFIYRIEK